nr:hypothetical protein [Tanacetum cinerariifolium]
FEYKHDYTVIDSPKAVMLHDQYGVHMMMRFNEIHKFSDGTLQQIDETLDYRVKEFRINRMNPGLNTRFWTRRDVDRSKAFMFAIQKRLKTRSIFRNLESFVGGRIREGDYRLLKQSSQPPQPPIASTEAPQMVSSVKLPILKKGEYIVWTMKIEQYLAHTDYALWEVILNARTKERKAKSTLLMAIPNEQLARFHRIKDAKTLWAAIKTRFGVVMLSIRVKRFYKKTRIKLEFNGKEPTGFEKNKPECFNCHRRGHVAKDCKSAKNLGNKSRDAGNAGYRRRDNGKRPVKEEDEQALVVYDGLEEEVTETVFDNRSSDKENSVANDRFKKGEGYQAVPPPLTGNYMPPKYDMSFAGLDDSIYKFKISETVTSLAKDEKECPETSTAFVKKPKEDRSSAPLIED